MATLTIRHVPDAIVERLKAAAKRKGQSMEQEVRDLLTMRYAPRSEVTRRIRQRWESLPPTSEADVRAVARRDDSCQPDRFTP
ncbi:MAG TPA: hypothetical protein VIG57_22350 [Candidatus Entotheonella sp.]|jgi:hypothetical protein